MSNQEILEKAIQKAIAGGWVYHGLTDEGEIQYTDTGVVVNWLRGGRTGYSAETIIFNHDFAKALWGNDARPCDMSITYNVGGPERIFSPIPAWVFHLMMMVKEVDPIEYLGENL
jgi:hypothetical protein